MAQKKRKKKRVQQGRRPPEVQGISKTMHFFQELQKWLFVGTLFAVVYVVFFMPVGTGNVPVDQGGNAGTVTEQTNKEFNLYRYLNEVKSAKGNLTFDCTFKMENGDVFKVESSKKFETRGETSSIVGSTIYNMNDNAAVLDDYTYISEGYRYSKSPSGYVKSAYSMLGGGNLNLGKIEEQMIREENMVKEDGVSCYKYSAIMTYHEMSNELRNLVRSNNVNIPDIKNVMLDLTMFITETGVPYKFVISFEDVDCMIKASSLSVKNGVATGELTLTFNSFNGVERIELPNELLTAPEGTYVFTDKVNRYMQRVGNN